MVDIHNYKRRLELTLNRIKESDMSNENKRTILEFHDYCLTEGLSICKLERYLYDLYRFAKILKKSLRKATKEEIKKIIVV